MTQKRLLKLLFGAILVSMLVVTIRASLQQSLWDAWPGFAENPWSIATLWDAYFGFLTFFVWVAWRERSTASSVVWFILIRYWATLRCRSTF
jgi:hypothetical protein